MLTRLLIKCVYSFNMKWTVEDKYKQQLKRENGNRRKMTVNEKKEKNVLFKQKVLKKKKINK